jgi:hypothetical protein
MKFIAVIIKNRAQITVLFSEFRIYFKYKDLKWLKSDIEDLIRTNYELISKRSVTLYSRYGILTMVAGRQFQTLVERHGKFLIAVIGVPECYYSLSWHPGCKAIYFKVKRITSDPVCI